MSSQLTVSQAAELLERLRTAVNDCTAREARIERDYREKREKLERRFKEEIEAREQQAQEQIAHTKAEFQAAKQKLNAKNEQRTAQISRAQKSAKRQQLQNIDNAEGAAKYPLQKGLLDTKRNRVEYLKQNDAALANFTQRLDETRQAYAAIEHDARKAFSGYGSFRRLISRSSSEQIDSQTDEHQLLQRLHSMQERTKSELAQFREFLLPQIFRVLPLPAWAVLLIGAGAALPFIQPISRNAALMAAGGALAVVVVLYLLSRKQVGALGRSIAGTLSRVRGLLDVAQQLAETRHRREVERIEKEAKLETERLESAWQRASEEARVASEALPNVIEQKCWRLSVKTGDWHRQKLQELERERGATTERIAAELKSWKEEFTRAHESRLQGMTSDHERRWAELEANWKALVEPVSKALADEKATVERALPPWDSPAWSNWQPPAGFQTAARFGHVELTSASFFDIVRPNSRLTLPDLSNLSVPLVLRYPQQGSILFETKGSECAEAINALNAIILRLIATSPPGKVGFTIIDPLKLGQSFASLMHLADYEEAPIRGRIWTQPNEIDERLAELNEHMEKVIQMYLRNDYATIADYNRQAGNIAEKYHFVVVADFPANFTETAVRKLHRIATSGARCGVFTLIHWDQRQTPPPGFIPDELCEASVCLACDDDQKPAAGEPRKYVLLEPSLGGASIVLDSPPRPEFIRDFLQKVGESVRGSTRVEVPFSAVAPPREELWKLKATDEVRVPIGRSGASKLQYLALGKGTRQHALIAGKTGSGKSTLFHVLITNLALWCSPEEVEFYLVDFKKGVEFKCYGANQLPHARVVAIESDREFGLSVLERVDEELRRRGDLFRRAGVQDLAGYKQTPGAETLPRTLLLIDEFQEFFVEDDRISQSANVLLDRIVRQGRAFGIHVLLGSQTLGGAYTLARTTMGQMVVRIALQCNEADSYLIMDENNAAPRLLSRPGEGIYNDMAGATEANSPFQAVWLSEEERDGVLKRIRMLADTVDAVRHSRPVVFEGNAPADIRENHLLAKSLEGGNAPSLPLTTPRIWLGSPNAIKGPTEAAFLKRSGSNLLVVGQRDEAIVAMVSFGLISLAAQLPPSQLRLVLFESTAPGSAERALFERLANMIGPSIKLCKPGDLPEIMNDLTGEMERRTTSDDSNSVATFLFIHGLQNFKKLRAEDEFSLSTDEAKPAAQLQKLLTEGTPHGMHVITTLDNYNNVVRFLGRKALGDFEMRVLFQMSANDSASLCDDPKANTLGLHRALFYNEHEGYLETFRPYARPSDEWIGEVANKLSRRADPAK